MESNANAKRKQELECNEGSADPSSTAKRPKYFMDKWMQCSLFRSWLKPHPDRTKARCNMCNVVLIAGYSELSKHAQTLKHEKAMALSQQAQHHSKVSVLSTVKPKNNVPLEVIECENNKGEVVENVQEIKSEDGGSNGDKKDMKKNLEAEMEEERIEEVIIEEEEEGEGEETVAIRKRNNGTNKDGASKTDDGASKTPRPNVTFPEYVESDGYENDTDSDHSIRSDSPVSNRECFMLYNQAILSKPAPYWESTAIVNGHTTQLKLSDYKGIYLVLFFYPLDFSKSSSQEINALSDNVSDFRLLNTEIVACSVDSHLCHQAWSKLNRDVGGVSHPKIPLLADPTHKISKAYGCYLPESGYNLRAHYIIDMAGILRYISITDMAISRNIRDLLAMVKDIQEAEHEQIAHQVKPKK